MEPSCWASPSTPRRWTTGSTVSEGEAERLALPLAWFWRSALRAAYPDREFVVEVTQDGGYGPEVTFYGR